LTISGKVKAKYLKSIFHEGQAQVAQDSGMSGASETVTEDNTTAAVLCGDMKGTRQCFTRVVWKLNLLLQNYPLPKTDLGI
jgi:hypothetical protein